jgi:uncharacterized protein (DUF2141 family)
LKLFLAIISLGLLFGCATQKLPEGGSKDIYAPKILTQYPENLSTEVQSSYMALEFDEFFKLDNPAKNIHISPRMKEAPNYEVKGKKLYVAFNEELKPNTTYIVSFNKAIKDYSEGNDTSFQIVFSTGSYLDSANLSLQILDSETGKGKKDMTVMLFPAEEDSIAFKGEPSYIFSSNENGMVRFNYIPDGSYQALAISDENTDLKYDRFSEDIAFWDFPISTQDTIFHMQYSFKEPDTSIYLNDWRFFYPNKFQFIFSQATQLEVNFKGKNTPFEESDTVIFYSQVIPSETDSIYISYGENSSSPLNSVNELQTDTLDLYYEAPKTYKVIPRLSKRTIRASEALSLEIDGILERIDSSKIMLMKDSVSLPFLLKKYSLNAAWEEGGSYQLIIQDSCFFDAFGFTNDSLLLNFTVFEGNYKGKLVLDLVTLSAYQIDLITQKGVVVHTINPTSNQKNIVDLPPGTYGLRAFADGDGSGKLTPGNYPNKQSEFYIFYPGEIKIKSGWDTEIQWTLNE